MKILPLLFLMTSINACRVDHRASGEVATTGEQKMTVEVIVRLDISGCMYLPEYDRLECVREVTNSVKELSNVAKILLCYRSLEEVSGDEGADSNLSCRELSTMENGLTGTGR